MPLTRTRPLWQRSAEGHHQQHWHLNRCYDARAARLATVYTRIPGQLNLRARTVAGETISWASGKKSGVRSTNAVVLRRMLKLKSLKMFWAWHLYTWGMPWGPRKTLRKPFVTNSFPACSARTPTKSKGSPYGENQKNCRIVDFDSSKKRLYSQNATQKTSALCKVPFLKKIKKKTPKVVNFASFSEFFRNGTLLRAEVFCIAFSASIHFFWAIKIKYRTFFYEFSP